MDTRLDYPKRSRSERDIAGWDGLHSACGSRDPPHPSQRIRSLKSIAVRVEYDKVAEQYDRRFQRGSMSGIAATLAATAAQVAARRTLEVGCGTGHWLDTLGAPVVLGADRSLGMLAKAAAKLRSRPGGGPDRTVASAAPTTARALATGLAALVAADALAMPFLPGTFDLVACVNALHHFPDARAFIGLAAALLRRGGALVVIGMDPSAGLDRWYLYDYFPETLPLDLLRYPPHAAVRRWMLDAGLERVDTRPAQRIGTRYLGAGVREDPILHRHGTSQLILLSDEAFARGIARIEEAIRRPGEPVEFVTEIVLPVTRGFKP